MSEKSFENAYNNLNSDKIYILSDYCYNKYVSDSASNLKNSYLIKNKISDLKNEDFKWIQTKKPLFNLYLWIYYFNCLI